GEQLRLDVLDRGGELRVLPRQVLGAVVLGERHVERALLPRARAEQLLLEAGDEPARAEFDHLVAALAALERLAVQGAFVVDDDEVALLGGPLGGLEAREPLAERLNVIVNSL